MWIKLNTKAVGVMKSKAIYLNMDKVLAIEPCVDGGTVLVYGENLFWIVAESITEVLNKFLR